MTDSRLLIPAADVEPWPTLGPEICDWIEAKLVHGPGDILGEPIVLTDEQRLFIYRAYEVYPRSSEKAGRRRFKRAVKSRRKGVGKTEDAAVLTICEFDPTSPVRCDGWRIEGGEWIPVGRAVRDPYIPMVAVTEEQTEDLAYAAVREILEHCELGESYDIGLERIRHLNTTGVIQALASSPNARDGARTTFQHFDETHLFVADRLKKAHSTMLRNIPKRFAADAWSLETTTAYEPGEDSIAEGSHQFALAISQGRIVDATLLFDHRQASHKWDLKKPRELRAAIQEASGDAWSYTDVDAIVSLFLDPQGSEADGRRYWLNQPTKGDKKWMAPDAIARLIAQPARHVEEGTPCVLAFDGSDARDSTALVGCTVEENPHVWVEGVWEKPIGSKGWRVPRTEVLEAIHAAIDLYDVKEFAPDPPHWYDEIEALEATYGDLVVRFDTNQPKRMGPACSGFKEAARQADDPADIWIEDVEDEEFGVMIVPRLRFTIEDSEPLRRHLANCVSVKRGPYTLVAKTHPDSPDKIDLAVGAIIAYNRAVWHFLNPATRSSWRPL